MQKFEMDIEQLLAEGKIIQIKPQGYSMYPFLVPGRDEAIIAPADIDRLRRSDVVLYRRDALEVGHKGILVLHRIWRRRGDRFYLVGDNQKEIEGPMRPEQIKGIMTAMIYKGRKVSVKNPLYRLLTGSWLVLRPVRPAVSKTVAKIKRIGRNLQK